MEVQYIVDSAAELGQLTPVETASLYLIDKAYRQVDQLILQNLELTDDFLRNTAREALSRASAEERHWVALNGLQHVAHLTKFARERATELVQIKVQHDLGVAAPFSLVVGTLENSADFWGKKVFLSGEDVSETNVRAMLREQMGQYTAALAEDVCLVDAALAWYQADGGEKFRELQAAHRFTRQLREQAVNARARKVSPKKGARSERPARSAIKKVCRLFAQFRQEKNLSLFVSGREVELSHPDSNFKFILRPLGEPGWLIARSRAGRAHTPYDLTLFTKSDVFIAKLCVYLDDTPVLDQLFGLTLFVQSGEELKILEKANFFGFAQGDALEQAKSALVSIHPALVTKFPEKRETNVDLDALYMPEVRPGHKYPVIDLGAPFRREKEHWEPYRGRVAAWVDTFFEPVLSQLLPQAQMLQLA